MKHHPWSIDQIPDQTGRVAIVTGSSSGIGLETARVLAAKNSDVIIAVRNLTKGRAARQTIIDRHLGARVSVMLLDLADLSSVDNFSREVKSNHGQLDLLINNAGVMVPPFGLTRDGFELQMGTNHLGHFALTGHLMPLLLAAPGSRIVNVSSLAHKMGNIDMDDLNWQNRRYRPWRAYGDSKIANLYFTFGLSRRMTNGRLTVAAAHPGWTATELQRHTPFTSVMNHLFAQQADMGALPSLYAALAPDVENGDFFGPGGCMEMKGHPVKVKSNALAGNKDIADRLWHLSTKMTGISFGELS